MPAAVAVVAVAEEAAGALAAVTSEVSAVAAVVAVISAVLAVASAVVSAALVVTSAVPVDASAEWAFPAAARDRDLERVPWAGRASAPWGTERVRLRAAVRASPRRGSPDPATTLSASPVVTSALQGRCA